MNDTELPQRAPEPVPAAMLTWALRELLGALPERRDWFNPDAEKVLRAALEAPQGALLTDDVIGIRVVGDAMEPAPQAVAAEVPSEPQSEMQPLVLMYHRHKEWARRSGYVAMDWQEFKDSRRANPLSSKAIEHAAAPLPPTPAVQAGPVDKAAEKEKFIEWSQVFHRNARSYTARDFDHGLIGWMARAHLAAKQPSTAARDQALLDFLDQWVKDNGAKGHDWFTFAFDINGTAREQIAAVMDLRTAPAEAGKGGSDQ